MPKIGAHVSAAGSLDSAFSRAEEIGAECLQIFISPPQQWMQINRSEADIKIFQAATKQTRIDPVFIHAVYLLNLATDNPAFLEKSISWLIYAQKMAAKLQVEGTILHLGSAKNQGRKQAIAQVILALKQVLAESNLKEPFLILENSAGAGELIGDKFSEIGKIIKAVDNPRLRLCLDTQHAFASGYDLRTKEGLDQLLAEIDQEIGLGKLVAIHCNDSLTEFNSKVDRHENIGEGLIGLEGFKNIVNHPALTNLPFILEVPGFTGTGPDQKNIKILKNLIKS